ncbi:MAG: heavy metal-binding domain-containing protein [Candidatus Shapirobacteria bacterium]|nr:heavy metal-binding domain-containing protein [Candidatus Shapirobacteria bacterium]
MNQTIVTTTDLNDKKCEILEIVFAYGSSSGGMFKTANPLEAYPKVRDQLAEAGTKIGADAVIGAHFDYRVASKQGCGGDTQAFEVFAYGTAVKFK